MGLRYNRSFDADTHRQDAASSAREHTSYGADACIDLGDVVVLLHCEAGVAAMPEVLS